MSKEQKVTLDFKLTDGTSKSVAFTIPLGSDGTFVQQGMLPKQPTTVVDEDYIPFSVVSDMFDNVVRSLGTGEITPTTPLWWHVPHVTLGAEGTSTADILVIPDVLTDGLPDGWWIIGTGMGMTGYPWKGAKQQRTSRPGSGVSGGYASQADFAYPVSRKTDNALTLRNNNDQATDGLYVPPSAVVVSEETDNLLRMREVAGGESNPGLYVPPLDVQSTECILVEKNGNSITPSIVVSKSDGNTLSIMYEGTGVPGLYAKPAFDQVITGYGLSKRDANGPLYTVLDVQISSKSGNTLTELGSMPDAEPAGLYVPPVVMNESNSIIPDHYGNNTIRARVRVSADDGNQLTTMEDGLYVPASTADSLGLGTMSTQNANAVNVTGGAIEVTTLVGATTVANTLTTGKLSVVGTSTLQGKVTVTSTLGASITGPVVANGIDTSGTGVVAEQGTRVYSPNNPPDYPVTSVSGKTGVVTLDSTDVSLGNVTNNRQIPTHLLSSGSINAITWCKLATFTAPGSASSGLQLMISGASNFGSSVALTDIVNISARGLTTSGITAANIDNFVQINRIMGQSLTDANASAYGIVNTSTTTFDLYIRVPAYTVRPEIAVLRDLDAFVSTVVYHGPAFADKVTTVPTGIIYANVNRTYTSSYETTPANIGALPTTGGTISGTLNVVGNLTENGERVYSASNPPSIMGSVGINTVGSTVIAGSSQTFRIYSPGISTIYGEYLQAYNNNGDIREVGTFTGMWECRGYLGDYPNTTNPMFLWMKITDSEV
jgi:hypothetical protein